VQEGLDRDYRMCWLLQFSGRLETFSEGDVVVGEDLNSLGL